MDSKTGIVAELSGIPFSDKEELISLIMDTCSCQRDMALKVINKILLVTISIVGEEAYKIYTKQAIKSMDPEYIKLQEEIDKEIDEIEKIEVE